MVVHTITKGFEKRDMSLILFNVELIAGFSLVWFGLFYVLHKHVLKTKSSDYARRVLSIVHWVVTFLLTAALYCEHLKLSSKSAEFKFEDVAIINALVYLVFDLVWNIYYKTETPLLMFNHGVLITTMALYIFRDTMRMAFIVGYCLIMCTEPLLHIRWFLKQHNKNAKIAEYIFIGVFIIIRVGVLTLANYKFIAADHVDNMDKALLLANYTTGLIFCIHIIGYLQRKHEGKEAVGHILRGVGAPEHPTTVAVSGGGGGGSNTTPPQQQQQPPPQTPAPASGAA